MQPDQKRVPQSKALSDAQLSELEVLGAMWPNVIHRVSNILTRAVGKALILKYQLPDLSHHPSAQTTLAGLNQALNELGDQFKELARFQQGFFQGRGEVTETDLHHLMAHLQAEHPQWHISLPRLPASRFYIHPVYGLAAINGLVHETGTSTGKLSLSIEPADSAAASSPDCQLQVQIKVETTTSLNFGPRLTDHHNPNLIACIELIGQMGGTIEVVADPPHQLITLTFQGLLTPELP